MDPFEAANQFAQILKGITPVLQSLVRAAHFALKNAESEDYLFPTIMNIFKDETVELNTKSTLFQFVEVLFNESYFFSQQPKYNYPYVQNMKEALPQILLSVLPSSNISNIHSAYTSLKHITKLFKIDCLNYIDKFDSFLLDADDIENLKKDVPFPEIDLDDEPETVDPLITTWNLLIKKKKQSQYERVRLLTKSEILDDDVPEDILFNIKEKTDKDVDKLTKKNIISRMEDDREAHKRSKETLWLVTRPPKSSYITEDEFLNHYWNKYHALDVEEDNAFLDSLDELNQVVAESYKDKQF